MLLCDSRKVSGIAFKYTLQQYLISRNFVKTTMEPNLVETVYPPTILSYWPTIMTKMPISRRPGNY